MRRTSLVIALTLILASSAAKADEALTNSSRELLAAKIEPLLKSKMYVGVVAGITIDGEHTVLSFGRTALDGGSVPDDRTLYEIGSITKVFTAICLADRVLKNQMDLEDPITKYLGPDAKAPEWDGHPITLVSLATHRSGLPSIDNRILVRAVFTDNPYATYTAENLREFLATCKLKRDVGAQYEYSNLGAGTLGYLLASTAGMSYEEMVIGTICQPLGLGDTRIELSEDQKGRLAKPYYAGGKPAKNWDLGVIAGAGAIRSTAHDMLRFLDANLGLLSTDLDPALRLAQQERIGTGVNGLSMGLGWHIFKNDDFPNSLVWHNGGTGGYRSFAGFLPNAKIGVVLLGNTDHEVDSVAMELLKHLQGPIPAGESP